MGAVILCEFPSANANARSWILDRVALLAISDKAELKFVGTEEATSRRAASETIAIRIAGVERADAILSEWRRDVLFPGFIETRLLRIESVNLAVAMFP
jgi:hypothetical protein